jgi:large conductance mechanosensitive channel
MSVFKEFKEFASKGNMLDLAVGVIIGGSFGAIISSLVNDVIMPPIGMLLGNIDFANLHMTLKQGEPAGPYPTVAEAHKAGAVTLNYGAFINAIVTFLIVAFVVFMVVRAVNRMRREEPAAAPTTKDCPFCLSSIALGAKRCPHCTSEIPS